MKKWMLICLVILSALVLVFFIKSGSRASSHPVLRLYAGAGLRPAVEKLSTAFAAKTGIRVEADYGGSGMILARAREDRTADLFLPGDGSYVDRLQSFASNVAERVSVAHLVPTIIVLRGNPKGVHGLADLTRSDVRVGLGQPDSCEVGRVSRKILGKANIDPATLKLQEALTVNELGVWVKMKTVDAAIVWDAIAANVAADVESIAIAPSQIVVPDVVLARLATSRNADAAHQFILFVHGPQGQEILHQTGYSITQSGK